MRWGIWAETINAKIFERLNSPESTLSAEITPFHSATTQHTHTHTEGTSLPLQTENFDGHPFLLLWFLGSCRTWRDCPRRTSQFLETVTSQIGMCFQIQTNYSEAHTTTHLLYGALTLCASTPALTEVWDPGPSATVLRCLHPDKPLLKLKNREKQ